MTAGRLIQRSRMVYHQLPLPLSIKKIIRWCYSGIVIQSSKALRKGFLRGVKFEVPSIRPIEQQAGVPDYIIWGVIDWHFRHQRPQQLALALTNTGRRVFYVSERLVDDERSGFDMECLDVERNLFQIKLYAKGAPQIYSSAPTIETVSQLRTSMGRLLEWANTGQIVSLVQHPFWYDIATVLPNSTLIYDCMDHHEGFGSTTAEVLSLETVLLQNADLTITTSVWLDQFVSPHSKRRALIRNAVNFNHFGYRPAETYGDADDRSIIGYYGAIAEWFDQDLLKAVATRFPACCILLIGADTVNAQFKLALLPNVKFIGEVPYEALPYYLYSFDVCLVPFKVIPLTLATNPVKVYEYLSAGKPVVSVNLPEMKQFGELVRTTTNTDEFLTAIENSLDEQQPDLAVKRRQAFAKEQTWAHRITTLIAQAETIADDPQVSVIVVTHNNVDLTRTCLASLDQHSNYSQLRIIVVDNASTDGTKKFLIEWAGSAPNRTIILNEENRGFAAANNQGLCVADGEYLVLLNNDTYVTPNWVRTLVRHLQRDKSIGLIGPVTNNIGNQAKIDIAYETMAEMLQVSAKFTRQNIGQTFPLRTAAFFCVMIPRDVFTRVGRLDEVFGKGFFEDDDYCRRIEQLKLRIVCAKDVFIHHHLSASFNKLKSRDRQDLFERNKAIYEAKWGKWSPHTYDVEDEHFSGNIFKNSRYLNGICNVCGNNTRLFYTYVSLWRESLICEHCLTTSRYRSVTRGILRAIKELRDVTAHSLASLPIISTCPKLRFYDTQPPFYYENCSYPLPDFLSATKWIDVHLSQYKASHHLGKHIATGITNQNLECLTFPDESFDIVVTTDVMEHIRLDDRAHSEIHRVLRPGGIYVFTVPHCREWNDTVIRIQINNPADPSQDIHLLEPEYHGDVNSETGQGIIAYRTYGKDLEAHLAKLGFEVEYSREDIPEHGIFNTELYYCRKVRQ